MVSGWKERGCTNDRLFLRTHLLVKTCVLVFQGADEPLEDCKGALMAGFCIRDGSKVLWSLAPVSDVNIMSWIF
jgi:hypothetical protein